MALDYYFTVLVRLITIEVRKLARVKIMDINKYYNVRYILITVARAAAIVDAEEKNAFEIYEKPKQGQ